MHIYQIIIKRDTAIGCSIFAGNQLLISLVVLFCCCCFINMLSIGHSYKQYFDFYSTFWTYGDTDYTKHDFGLAGKTSRKAFHKSMFVFHVWLHLLYKQLFLFTQE